jgi:hypothetical protein
MKKDKPMFLGIWYPGEAIIVIFGLILFLGFIGSMQME